MIELGIEIFFGVLKFIFGDRIDEIKTLFQLRVKRLDIHDDLELQEFVYIYDKSFPEENGNYTSSFLISSLEDIEKNQNKRHVECDEIYLVAKYNNSIIGFLALYYYPIKKYGIIGYMAIPKNDPKSDKKANVNKYVGRKLVRKLLKIIPKDCELIVYETEGKKVTYKNKLFTNYSEKLKVNNYKIGIDILRPRIHLDDNTEDVLDLHIIPLKEEFKEKTITKEKLLAILDFLLFCSYGDFYPVSDKNHEKYHEYLKSKYNSYVDTLPDKILLEI